MFSFINGPMNVAEHILKSGSEPGFILQIIDIMTNTGPDRNDILFGLVLIGMALGSGVWIGWEMARFLLGISRKLWKLVTVGPDKPKVFKRPTQDAADEVTKA